MKKFDLFIGYMGNGAIVCNKAICSNGDYKNVAHISPAGNIKFYVSPGYIPGDAMESIKAIAKNHKNITIDRLDKSLSTDRCDFNYHYSRVLEEITNYTPYNDSIELLNALKDKPLREKIKLIKEYYISHF